MLENAGAAAVRVVHPCPVCKEAGKNALLVKEDHQLPVPKVPDLKKTTILPTMIEVLVFIVDQYICRTCGISYNKIKQEKTIMAPAQYQDESGKAFDPRQAR